LLEFSYLIKLGVLNEKEEKIFTGTKDYYTAGVIGDHHIN